MYFCPHINIFSAFYVIYHNYKMIHKIRGRLKKK